MVVCVDPVTSLFQVEPENAHAPSPLARICSLCVLALLATAASAQSNSGNMMKMNATMKMQVPGVGHACAYGYAGRVHLQDHDVRAMLQQQQGCTVSDYPQVGDVVSYRLVCGGKPPKTTGDARFELLPNNGNIRGSVHANSSMVARASWT